LVDNGGLGSWKVERKMIGLVAAGPLRLQVREVKADPQNMERVHLKLYESQGIEERDNLE